MNSVTDYNAFEGLIPRAYVPDERTFSGKEGKVILLENVAKGTEKLSELLAQLNEDELAALLGGQPNTGVANTFGMGNLSHHGIRML